MRGNARQCIPDALSCRNRKAQDFTLYIIWISIYSILTYCAYRRRNETELIKSRGSQFWTLIQKNTMGTRTLDFRELQSSPNWVPIYWLWTLDRWTWRSQITFVIFPSTTSRFVLYMRLWISLFPFGSFSSNSGVVERTIAFLARFSAFMATTITCHHAVGSNNVGDHLWEVV